MGKSKSVGILFLLCTALVFACGGGDQGAGSNADATAGRGDGGLGNGFNCAEHNQCNSGFCSDGVCCSSACDAPCDACSVEKGATLPGVCAVVSVGSPGNPSCSPYACSGIDVQCPTSCQGSADCGDGTQCVDNRCCDSACDGVCSSCAVEGSEGSCTPYEFGTDPEDECGGVGCNGMGDCTCNDDGPGEPNEDQTMAHAMPGIDDCDGSGSSVQGVLTGASDKDWYRFNGEDTFSCREDVVVSVSGDVASTLCVYVKCMEDSGSTEVTCDEGSSATGAGGFPGCCGNSVDISPDCSGTDEAITVYISLESTEAICSPYTITYHY